VVGSWANDGLTIQECIDMAQIWNSRNVPPLPDTELKRTVESIYEKHYSDRSHSPHTEMGLSERLDVDLVSVLQRGSDLQLLESDIKWSVDKLIPEQSITLLHGRGGIGKTWLSLILADAVSKRKPFMGLETRQSPVVVVDFENSLPVLIDRVKRIGIEDVLFWHTSNDQLKPPRLDSKQWQHYKDLPAGSLIIFDTVRAAQGQDENDSRQMAFILNRLKELRDLGFTIILLHHTTKGNERKYKGSTAILDLADQVLSLHKVKGGGMEEIAEDDEDDPDAVYRLGTKDKTRYEPFHTFLMFNAAKGFQVAPDPDTSTLESMYQLLEEKGRLNTNQFFEEVKEQLEIHGRGTFQRLLKKGIGNYWQAEKEGKANYYSIVPKSDIYSGDYETDAETPGDAVISAEGGSR
jgi:archaellum biogenesis ATPase FlaH